MAKKKIKPQEKPEVKIEIKKDSELTAQQELFCVLYASDRDFFGNGVQAYIEAYDIDVSEAGQYNVAKSGAHENLTKAYILKRINELLDLTLNDTFVDKQLALVITQNADLPSKVRAMSEYNKLRGRITIKQKHAFEGISDESLADIAAGILAEALSGQSGTGN